MVLKIIRSCPASWAAVSSSLSVAQMPTSSSLGSNTTLDSSTGVSRPVDLYEEVVESVTNWRLCATSRMLMSRRDSKTRENLHAYQEIRMWSRVGRAVRGDVRKHDGVEEVNGILPARYQLNDGHHERTTEHTEK